MNKSIIIIDTPEICDKCPLFCNYYTDMSCVGLQNRTINYPYPEDFRQEWCPLKPVPEKKQQTYGMVRQNSTGAWETYGEKVDTVAVGYNQCIDEILKE